MNNNVKLAKVLCAILEIGMPEANLLMWMIDTMPEGGEFRFPGRREVAEELDLTLGSVNNALHKLITAEYIIRTGTAEYKPTLYVRATVNECLNLVENN